MPARIIDGKGIARAIRDELSIEVKKLAAQGIIPGLAAVMVGDDPASRIYVGMKAKACKKLGIHSDVIEFAADIGMEKLEARIRALNEDNSIHGILVQSPLPGGYDQFKVNLLIDPRKDVDGFHPENLGRMMLGRPVFVPATPAGIVELLRKSNIKTAGRRIAILGRGDIVGKPLSVLLSLKGEWGDATVTLCHSRTGDLREICRESDIVVAAMGKPEFVTAEFIREGATVIDVGTNRVPDPSSDKGYRLTGDVDFDSVKEKAGAITPVPGGVGPMTIAMLLRNTVQAARLSV